MRTLVEFRTDEEHQIGDVITVESFEPGQKREGVRDLDRQGLPGHDPAPQLQPRADEPRLAQRRAPGSIGASADPSRVFKGTRIPGRMGGRRVTQRAARSSRSTPSATCCWSRGRARPPQRDRRGAERWLGREGARPRRHREGRPAGGRVLGAVPRVARARDGARRSRRAPPWHRLGPDARRGLDDDREGVAAEGPRSGSRRRAQRPSPPRRRRRVRSEAAAAHREGEPQGAPACVARRALGPRGARHRGAARRREASRSPRPSAPPRHSTSGGRTALCSSSSTPRRSAR